MRIVLYILLGALAMFIILKVTAVKGSTNTSQTTNKLIELAKTMQVYNLLKTNEFREVVKTKQFREFAKSLAEDQLIVLASTLTL